MLELTLTGLKGLSPALSHPLERETWRLLSASYLRSRKLEQAIVAFEKLRTQVAGLAERAHIDDQLERLEWLMRRASGISGQNPN